MNYQKATYASGAAKTAQSGKMGSTTAASIAVIASVSLNSYMSLTKASGQKDLATESLGQEVIAIKKLIRSGCKPNAKRYSSGDSDGDDPDRNPFPAGAIVITKTVENDLLASYNQKHMAAFFIDNQGTIYFFSFEGSSIIWKTVDDPSILLSVDSMTKWISQNYDYEIKPYTEAVYIQGDFSKSIDYAKNWAGVSDTDTPKEIYVPYLETVEERALNNISLIAAKFWAHLLLIIRIQVTAYYIITARMPL